MLQGNGPEHRCSRPFSKKERKIWIEYVYGLLIGAVDFNDWKNGILCSGRDGKVLEAKSGMQMMTLNI